MVIMATTLSLKDNGKGQDSDEFEDMLEDSDSDLLDPEDEEDDKDDYESDSSIKNPESEQSGDNGDSVDESEAEDSDADQESKNENKSGWADAMAKVLNTGKTLEKLVTILSKAKKDASKESTSDKSKKLESYAVRKAKKREIEEIGRLKPDIVKDKATEKRLNKLATKGVVQLFNAVREQQKSLKSELNVAGRSIRKREKAFQNIDKDKFMDAATSGTKKKKLASNLAERVRLEQSKVKMEQDMIKLEQPEDESSWKILRDDYMMNAKMKDWDKEEDSD